jgi:hypothetical protein
MYFEINEISNLSHIVSGYIGLVYPSGCSGPGLLPNKQVRGENSHPPGQE